MAAAVQALGPGIEPMHEGGPADHVPRPGAGDPRNRDRQIRTALYQNDRRQQGPGRRFRHRGHGRFVRLRAQQRHNNRRLVITKILKTYLELI